MTQSCKEQFQHIERLSATHAAKEKHASFSLRKIGRLRQTGSAHRGLSLNRQAHSKTESTTSTFHFEKLLSLHIKCFVAAQGYLCHLPVLQELGNCVGIDVTKPHRIWSCCVRNFPPYPSGSRGLQFWNPVEPFQCSERPIFIKMSLVVYAFYRHVVDGALGQPHELYLCCVDERRYATEPCVHSVCISSCTARIRPGKKVPSALLRDMRSSRGRRHPPLPAMFSGPCRLAWWHEQCSATRPVSTTIGRPWSREDPVPFPRPAAVDTRYHKSQPKNGDTSVSEGARAHLHARKRIAPTKLEPTTSLATRLFKVSPHEPCMLKSGCKLEHSVQLATRMIRIQVPDVWTSIENLLLFVLSMSVPPRSTSRPCGSTQDKMRRSRSDI